MTKRLSILTMAVSMLLMVTGCLKDKGFDNQQYGIQIGEVKGVLFPQAVAGKVEVGVISSATPVTIDGPLLTLEEGGPAASDVRVVISTNNPSNTSLLPLPAGSFTFAPSTVIIPKGSTLTDALKITFPNSSALDPNKQYGLGFTIVSVDQGYRVASNLKKVDFVFSVKNKYDGKYRLKNQFYHPTAASSYPLLNTDLIELRTTGPNTVKMYCLIPGITGFYHPWSTGSSLTAFGSQEPSYTVNPTTNAVTVDNTFTNAVTIYSMGKGYNNAGYNSRYDASTKTIYANFGYNLVGGNFDATTTRMWIDTLIWTGPR